MLLDCKDSTINPNDIHPLQQAAELRLLADVLEL
jgi:hypothetical protein